MADSGDLDALSACAMLFLSEGAEEEWQKLQPLVAVAARSSPSARWKGSWFEGRHDRVLHRSFQSGKVRMKVNLAAMRDADISLSARFLALKSVDLLGEREEA